MKKKWGSYFCKSFLALGLVFTNIAPSVALAEEAFSNKDEEETPNDQQLAEEELIAGEDIEIEEDSSEFIEDFEDLHILEENDEELNADIDEEDSFVEPESIEEVHNEEDDESPASALNNHGYLPEDAKEIRVTVNVRRPSNMENYVETLADFQEFPLVLTNRVTGEVFSATVVEDENNQSNDFTLESNVHVYERGTDPANTYDISMPQELADLGYETNGSARIRANHNYGSATLSYSAPHGEGELGRIERNIVDYGYLDGRNIEVLLDSQDGLRTYKLTGSSSGVELSSGDYNIRVKGASTDSRTKLVVRENSSTNAPETEIELEKDGDDYLGKVSLDFTGATRPKIFKFTQAEWDEGPNPEEAREVRVTVNVQTPNNMEDYENTLEDFSNYPLVFTNQVTGEVFYSNVVEKEGNVSNKFQLESTVHAYESGYAPENDYDITLPPELEELGYSLTRDHRVRSNFGIVGTTNLSYNTPHDGEELGELDRNIRDYDFLDGRNLEIFIETLDGSRTYKLGNRTIELPSGEYRVRVIGSPEDSRPELVIRESSLANAAEEAFALELETNEYVGNIVLDFSDSTRPQVLKLSPAELEIFHTVTIDANGGTIDEEFETTELEDGETFTLPYTFQSGLAREGYTLTGYSVEGTLLDKSGNEVTELSHMTGEYTPVSDVTLTAQWEVTSGGFRIRDSVPGFKDSERSFVLTDGENNYPLTSTSFTNLYRTWSVDDVPNGTYTLLVDGVEYTASEWLFEKAGQPATESNVNVDDEEKVTFDLTFEDNRSTTFIRYQFSVNEYDLGVEVRDSSGSRTSEIGVTVTNTEGEVFTGSYNEYNQWLTDATLVAGEYMITLETPKGTVAEVNETVANQFAVATDEDNVFTIELNTENQGSFSAIYGAFKLVEIEEVPIEEGYQLGVEVRNIEGSRTSEVDVTVTDTEGKVFVGSYNDYQQWLTEELLVAGEYTITLETPEGTVAEINNTITTQYAVATDEDNVFTIELNAENQSSLSSIYGAFRLVEEEPEDSEDPDEEDDSDELEDIRDEIIKKIRKTVKKVKDCLKK